MFLWKRKPKPEDTQPLPSVTSDKIEALKVLNEARNRRAEAEQLNKLLTEKVSELSDKKRENHFYQSFIAILRTE